MCMHGGEYLNSSFYKFWCRMLLKPANRQTIAINNEYSFITGMRLAVINVVGMREEWATHARTMDNKVEQRAS